MIRRLEGEVVDVTSEQLVLDVGGVGYAVAVRRPEAFPLGQAVALWTHLAVRETALDLYGFLTRDELDVFELLLTLPKVGPKSAMGIMAQADIALLKDAVAQGDASYLSKMSGIGKKTAEKIVHELRDKFADLALTSHRAGAVAGPSSHHGDTIDALVALGYPEREAREAVKALPPEIERSSDAIREALKHLST